MNEKQEIADRLREEILLRYGSIKEFSKAIGKTQQFVNVYVSGINAPGPKMRRLLREVGLDVPYIMTGRRGEEPGDEKKELKAIRVLMTEKGIKNAAELRRRLDRDEALARMLGPEVYKTIVKAAVMRDKRAKYRSRK